jgi:hypothetical protein
LLPQALAFEVYGIVLARVIFAHVLWWLVAGLRKVAKTAAGLFSLVCAKVLFERF